MTNPAISSAAVIGTSSVILIIFEILGDDGADKAARFRLTIDGSPITNGPQQEHFIDATNEASSMTLAFCVDGLSAGNHSFGVEWINQSGTMATATDRSRFLQIWEFPNASIVSDN